MKLSRFERNFVLNMFATNFLREKKFAIGFDMTYAGLYLQERSNDSDAKINNGF